MKYSWCLLLCSISWYLLEFNAEKYEECSIEHRDTTSDVTRCFPDNSGYADFSCVRLSDITKNSSDADTLVWKQAGDKTDCEAPYNGCQCFVESDEFSYDEYCKCIEGTAKVAEKNEECQYLDSAETRCFADNSGYADFSCEKLSDITKNKSDANTLVWKQLGRKTECKKPFNSGCQCFVDWDVFYYEQYCKCFLSFDGGPPKFPSIGVIRWNGGWSRDEYYDEDTERDLMGEVHKNSNGQYMTIEWTVGQKSDASFKILVPGNRGMFTKYVGTMGKECQRHYGYYSEEDLSSIWEKYFTDKGIERARIDGKIQKWKKFEQGSDWYGRWEWTIEYNEEKDYAIPISYYNFEAQENMSTQITRYDYTYQSIGDDESFDLHTYCPEEKWR